MMSHGSNYVPGGTSPKATAQAANRGKEAQLAQMMGSNFVPGSTPPKATAQAVNRGKQAQLAQQAKEADLHAQALENLADAESTLAQTVAVAAVQAMGAYGAYDVGAFPAGNNLALGAGKDTVLAAIALGQVIAAAEDASR
jgi:hypothetical protein